MDQILLMGGSEPGGRLAADADDFLQRQLPVFLEKLIEGRAFEQLHCKKGNAAVFVHLVNADDIIALQSGGGAGLAQESSFGSLIRGELRQHHLERDPAIKIRIVRQEHHSHSALAENRKNAIRTKPADFVGLLGCGEKARAVRVELNTGAGFCQRRVVAWRTRERRPVEHRSSALVAGRTFREFFEYFQQRPGNFLSHAFGRGEIAAGVVQQRILRANGLQNPLAGRTNFDVFGNGAELRFFNLTL